MEEGGKNGKQTTNHKRRDAYLTVAFIISVALSLASTEAFSEGGTVHREVYTTAIRQVLDEIISGPFGSSLEAQDGRFYAAGRDKVMSFRAFKDYDPVLSGFFEVSGRIDSMRLHDSHAYVDTKGGRTYTLDITDPSNIFQDGTHDVAYWVGGLEILDHMVFLLDGNRIRIATIQWNGGWPW